MKFLLLVALAVVAAQAVSHEEALSKWADFQKTFGKVYTSSMESRKRFQIFTNTLEEIEAHNKLYEAGQVGWYQKVGPFSDLTKEEWKATYLTKFPANYSAESMAGNLPVQKLKYDPSIHQDAPSWIDWTQHNAVTQVKDQAQCGSCWSFSATGALEGQQGIHKGQLLSLSEQIFVDCTYPKPRDGCGGGWMNEAYANVGGRGIPEENAYPYVAHTQECQNIVGPVRVTQINVINPDDGSLVWACGTQGPIAVAFDVEPLMNYGGGVYDGGCSQSTPNHAVTLVGYGNQDGKDFYLMKNQWGTWWGETGYFKLIRGRNQCGVTNWASYPSIA